MSKNKHIPKVAAKGGALSFKKINPSKIRFTNKHWFALLALAVVTYLIFLPSLKCEFTNWDDGTYVTENPLIWKLDKEALAKIFSTPVSLNYHPLTMLSLAMDYSIDKMNPRYFHLTNVLIHLLNALLLFIFLLRLMQAYQKTSPANGLFMNAFNVALLTSISWAIHPLRVESVTWVAERKDVLYVFFFLLSLISYLKYREQKKLMWMIFSFLFFIASCLSKGMAVVLPVVLVLLDWFLAAEEKPARIKSFINWTIAKAHFFIASAGFGVLAFKIQSQGAIAAMSTFTFFQRVTFACYGFIMYLWKLILPLHLSAFYPYPFTDAQGNIPAIYYASPLIVLSIVGIIVFLFYKNKSAARMLTFGFLFYFVCVALVLQFISVGSVIMADRYTYLSHIGIIFAGVFFFERTKNQFSKNTRSIAYLALAGVLIWFAYLTYQRTKVWTNAETLWTDAMNQFPFIEIAYENRGIYYKDHNELDKMLADYEFVTQKLNSKNEKIWSNLGNLYGLRKEFDKSLHAYSKAIEFNPQSHRTYLNRAITYSMMGKYTESLPDYDKSISMDSSEALTYKNRAYTRMQLGQFELCIKDYDKALLLFPYDTVSFLNRGIAKFNAKQYALSLDDFKKYSSMVPANSAAYYNAAVAAANINRFGEALQYARQAQKMGYPISQQYMEELRQKSQSK
jgi:protein O-mannosyl-transferase